MKFRTTGIILIITGLFLIGGSAAVAATATQEPLQTGPSPDISASPSNPTPGDPVTFEAIETTLDESEIQSYEWTYDTPGWGDGSASGESFTHEFEELGEFDVTLEVTDTNGETESTTKTIEVGGEGPDADFSYSPRSPAPFQEIQFDASSSTTTGLEIEDYEWEYETADGTSTTRGESFTTEFEEVGSFEVTLTITDSHDRTDSISKTVSTSSDGPTAAFDTDPSDPDLDQRVTFDSESADPTLDIVEHNWFINGEPVDGDERMTQTFEEPDEYTVELEVENEAGLTDRISETYAIGDPDDIWDNPDFDLLRNTPGDAELETNPGETVVFDAEIFSERLPQATQTIYVNGDQIEESEVETRNIRTTEEFEEMGTHTVAIEVDGIAGQSDQVSWEVTTHPFNSLPTIDQQSTQNRVEADGNADLLTFSVQNPEANDQEISAEIVTSLPDGVSISGASGVTAGDAAIQTTSETISPGRQESMRLTINIEDEGLDGKELVIPYEVRYYALDDEQVVFTEDSEEIELLVGEPPEEDDDQESTDDSSPGFGMLTGILSLVVLASVWLSRAEN